jgi:hypothetical protein
MRRGVRRRTGRLKPGVATPIGEVVPRHWKIRTRRVVRVHRNRLIAGAAALTALGGVLIGVASTSGRQELPPREVVCAQTKRDMAQIRSQYGDHAPSKEAADKLTKYVCAHGAHWFPGTDPNDR